MVKALIVLAVLMASTAQAQVLRDPTQPPAVFAQDRQSTAENAAETELRPVLGAIIRQHDGAALALINGRLYRRGALFGDQRIARIEETRVLLRGPDGYETLVLSPELNRGRRTGE
jgi:hypothetical protein